MYGDDNDPDMKNVTGGVSRMSTAPVVATGTQTSGQGQANTAPRVQIGMKVLNDHVPKTNMLKRALQQADTLILAVSKMSPTPAIIPVPLLLALEALIQAHPRQRKTRNT